MQPIPEELNMVNHKAPVDLSAKSVFKKNLLSLKSVLGSKRKAKVSEVVT